MCSRISCFLFWTISKWHYIPNETRQFAVIKVFRSCEILVGVRTRYCVSDGGMRRQKCDYCSASGLSSVARYFFSFLYIICNISTITIASSSPSPSTSSQSPLCQHDHDHLFTFKIITTSITSTPIRSPLHHLHYHNHLPITFNYQSSLHHL
jgi:hypothetical protein